MRRARVRALLLAGVLGAASCAVAGQAVAASAGPVGASQPAPSPVLPHVSVPPTSSSEPTPPPAVRPPEQARPPVVASSPGQSQLDRGRQLYGAGCAGCHGQTGGGSPLGPSLLGVGPATTDFYLATGRMPLSRVVQQAQHHPPAYDQQDIDALVAYVSSLAPGGEPIPAVSQGNLQSGRELYLLNCASCHASSGVGEALPGGNVAPSLLSDGPTQVAEAIRVGPGLMPQFPRTALTDAQIDDIASYVQALPARMDHGGWAIGAIGPVAEGLFGFVVGLGLLLVVIRLLGKRAAQ